MPSGARLWWVQHGSPQGIAQETAACTWPCETGRRCSSAGGIIVDSGSTISESQQEAEAVFSRSLCTSASSQQTRISLRHKVLFLMEQRIRIRLQEEQKVDW